MLRIRLEDICFRYPSFLQKGKEIFNNVKLEFGSGKLYVILGDSGSGKTTLLRLVKGMYKPNSGRIVYMPADLKKKIFLIPSIDALFFFADIVETELDKVPARVLKLFRFPEKFLKKRIAHLSDGYKVLLSIIIAYAAEADFFLFDDVAAVLDPTFSHIFKNVLRTLLEEGKGVIIATNEYDKFLRLQPEILRIDKGQIVPYVPQKTYYELIKDAS